MYSNWSKLVIIFHRSSLDLDLDLWKIVHSFRNEYFTCLFKIQNVQVIQNDVIKCCKMMSPHSNEPATWRNCVSRRHFYYHRRTFPSHRGESTISQKWCAPRRGRRVIDIGGKIRMLSSGGSRIFPRWGRQHTTLPKFPWNCIKLKEFGSPRGGVHPKC